MISVLLQLAVAFKNGRLRGSMVHEQDKCEYNMYL